MGVIAAYSVNGLAPTTVGGTGTGVFYFSDLPPVGTWNSTESGVNAGLTAGAQYKGQTPSSTSNVGGLPVPGRSVLNGQPFSIQAAGNYSFGLGEASTTVTVTLKLSTASNTSTSPNYQTLATFTSTNAQDVNDGVFYPWAIGVDLSGDTLSGILQSAYYGWIDGTYTSPTGNSAITGVNFATEPAFVLVVGMQFGASNSGNTANLYQLEVYGS